MTSSRPEDFAADTLAILHRRKVTFRGLPPHSIEIFLDGAIKIWFAGTQRDGTESMKGITIMDRDPIQQAVHMGKPEIIADLCEQLIDHNSARYF